MSIIHKHHIIPRHMGGNDDPSNLVSLTILEHAEAHKKLWDTYQKEEDFIAWQALSGQATMSEIQKMRQKLGSRKGSERAKQLNRETNGALARIGGNAVRDKKTGIHSIGYDKGIGGRIGGKITGPTTQHRRWFTDGINDTRVHINDIEEFKVTHPNWHEGRTFKPSLGILGKTANTKWVSKDGKRKRIKATELETFIRLGYTEGMS